MDILFHLLRVPSCYILLSVLGYGAHRVLHSFPTRRSSDLIAFWGWSCGSAWNWIASGSYSWTELTIPPQSPGRASRRFWPSTGCVRRADRKSTRLNSSHTVMSYAVFCLKKKNLNGHIVPPTSRT